MTTKKRLFNLLLTRTEARTLTARAKAAGITKSAFVRRLIAESENNGDVSATAYARRLFFATRRFLAEVESLSK